MIILQQVKNPFPIAWPCFTFRCLLVCEVGPVNVCSLHCCSHHCCSLSSRDTATLRLVICFWSPYLCMLVGCFVNGGGWWGLLWRSHGVVVTTCGWGRPWVVVVFSLAKFYSKPANPEMCCTICDQYRIVFVKTSGRKRDM